MAFVVTENCIRCKYQHCVAVCPVDCFHAGPNFLVINPDECIDCTLCEPECPANAIYAEADLPANLKNFSALNRELAAVWPIIAVAEVPPSDADQWLNVEGKLAHLERLENRP